MMCTFNLCEFIKKEECPKGLSKRNPHCNCPIKKGKYNIKDWTIVKIEKLNSFIKANMKGEIQAKLEIMEENDKDRFACIDIESKVE